MTPASRPAAAHGRSHPLVVLQSVREVRDTTNPYIAQLLSGLQGAEDIRVERFTWRTALLGRWDVLHLHWPELVFRRSSSARTLVGMVLFLVLLVRARVLHRAVVRTVHNTVPHEPGLPGERALLRLCDRWTTTALTLSDAVRLPGVPEVAVPHGDYVAWFAGQPHPAAVPGRVASVGLIRPYKGVEGLVAAFRSTQDATLSLHVVGKPSDEAIAAAVRDAAGDDRRVTVRLGHAADPDLAREVGEAELVVLPYRTMQNSGAALLALSLDRPVLLPDNRLNRALQQEVGPGWVQLFEGDLTAGSLERALAAVRAPRSASPDLSRRAWPRVVSGHVDAYRGAVDAARRAPAPDRLSIAMVGTRGVPARYGGFETCIEEVGRRLADAGHDVVVYCRAADGQERPAEYLGMRLVHLPAVRHRVLETLSHTALSVLHLLVHRTDAVLVFNAANAPFLPMLRLARMPVATHVDGLEWQRAKWGAGGRRYYRTVERLAVEWSDALIADATGISDYYRDRFAAETVLISYGAPLGDGDTSRLGELELSPDAYHLVVARFEPENHVDVAVQGYVASQATLPLVVVGTAPYADEYIARVHALADDRVRFLGAVWDQDLLDQLYSGARTYVHGHSVGGTNPSLLRAIGAGAPTIAWDVNFNREVLQEAGEYFSDPASLAALLQDAEAEPARWHEHGEALAARAREYDWDDVAARYGELSRALADRTTRRPRPRRSPLTRGSVHEETR